MPRKPKQIASRIDQGPPFGEEEASSEDVHCQETDCPGLLVALDQYGFGVCDRGHAGQPVPDGTWRPAAKPSDPNSKNPMRHEFELDLEVVNDEDETKDVCRLCKESRAAHTTALNRLFLDEHALDFCECGHTGLGHFEGAACAFMVNDENCGCGAFLSEKASKDKQPPLFEVPPETHQGRAVLGREVALGGSAEANRYRIVTRDWWDTLRIGMTGKVEISYEVIGDGFKPVRVEGQIIGLTDTRKLKLISFVLPELADVTEGLPLWEDGAVTADAASKAPRKDCGHLADDASCDCAEPSPLGEASPDDN